MNKLFRIVCLGLSVFSFLPVRACDVCGCVSNSGYTGLVQGVQGHMAGLRMRFQHFRHPASSFHETGQVRVTEDVQMGFDVWGRWQPHVRWQVWANLPVKHHIRLDESGYSEATGIGDGQLTFLWEAVSRKDTAQTPTFRWWLGGGVQLPTGKTGLRDRFGLLFPMWFQPGTAVWGGLFQTTVAWQKGVWGVQGDFRLKHSFSHPNGDRPGFQSGLYGMVFRSFTRPKGRWLPQAGLALDYFARDHVNGVRDEASGGLFGFGQLGIEWLGSRWFGQMQVRIPLGQIRPATQPGNTLVGWLGLGYRW